MRVRANQHGFYDGSHRRPGDEFEVSPKAKAKWFDPVDAEKSKRAKPSESKVEQADDLA
jgi:hypothetical protein